MDRKHSQLTLSTLAFVLVTWTAAHTMADTVTLQAGKDNTLYQDATGSLSNGAGQHFFSGNNDNNLTRRGLIAFSFASIPTGSTINSVTLTLNMSRSRAQNETVTLHRVQADWGEGASVAGGEEGGGAPATTGDATWLHRFYNTLFWSAVGGDYSATASASTVVAGQNGFYSWSSAGMVTDVQFWLNNPGSNFGWLLHGNEATNKTTKRFDSRQNTTTSRRPQLTVNYTPPAQASGACCFSDGTCQVLTQTNCTSQSGTYQGDDTSCSPNPCPQPTGACCFTNGTCQLLTQTNCTSQGGTYQGNGTSCSPNPCPPPTGACCLPSGVCQIVTQPTCTGQGGTYQGDGTSCSPNPCPQPTGACCLPGGSCEVLTQTDCTSQGGLYQGNGASCSPNPCTGSQQVTLVSVKDNTLYEDAAGSLSNGKGIGFFAGKDTSLIRRGLVAFDLTSIPAGAIVTNVQLQLYLGFTQATGAHDVTLHRALASWGEGTSDATGNESGGAASTTSDATWIHRFYNTTLWTLAGGDFTATASATTSVGTTTGFYTWSSAGLIADVQAWVNSPAANLGWLLRCNEAVSKSQRRFDTRESATPTQRPMLTVTYTVQPPSGACCFADGSCQALTQTNCTTQGGAYQGDGTTCDPNPCPQPTGACCFADGSCQVLTQTSCTTQGGTYHGNGSSCTPNPCPQPSGACCFADGSCQTLTQTNCTTQGGDYQGDGTTCTPNTCPQPTGACCFADGACQELTQANCTAQGGVYDGNGTTCIPNPCPEPTGACCLNSGVCVVTTQADCTVQAGIYQGTDTVCAPDLCPVVLEPFVDALPLPGVAQPDTGVPGGQATYTIPITEFWQKLHRDLPPTRVWGYGGSYPGPTIVASVGQPVMVTWVNDLRDENGVPRTTHYLPVDLCPDGAANEPRVVAHLHGGHVPPESDGYPEAWFLPGQSATTAYPNEQLPSTIWYHDHAMGMTRLNVYMGLAGFYLITDVFEQSLGLPEGAHEAGLAIQDRWFNPDGTLKYMEMWDEHFFGDKMLVNGKVWPYFEVDRGKYRFRMLNGCNSRVLTLALSDGASFWLIGMEGGLLPAPVPLTQITIGPGERADVVMDFAAHEPAAEVLLTNSAPAPFPGTPGEGVIPNVMKFIVTAASGHTAPLPATLRPMEVIPESSAVRSRELVLRKQSDACTGQAWLINGLHWMDITEVPHLGTVEIWNFINRSGVSHPMHLHLVMFQVLDRQPFEVVSEQIVPTGPRVPAPPGEGGWKDTVLCPPNEITRVITRFEGYAGLYPYHCHILEHEDHEMMRQFRAVVPSDLNEDGYVDESDVELFKLCTSRATVPVAPGCESSDLDGDGDADQNDFGLLQRCYGGANQPPPHGCSG